MNKTIWRLKIEVPRDAGDVVVGILALNTQYGWEEEEGKEENIFILHSGEKAFLDKIATELKGKIPDARMELDRLEETDWLSSWKEFFTPVQCGNTYVILPPWLKDDSYGERRKIIIDPKSAFGTGHHATTSLCLTALDRLLMAGRLHAGQSFLDLGCGTGVLGIGAALAGLKGICVDVDPLAIENARENAEVNHVGPLVEILEGSIEQMQGRQFDLIMANILADPLIGMAQDIVKCLDKRGCLILSGILGTQGEKVTQAYMACGMPEPVNYDDGEWRALVWA